MDLWVAASIAIGCATLGFLGAFLFASAVHRSQQDDIAFLSESLMLRDMSARDRLTRVQEIMQTSHPQSNHACRVCGYTEAEALVLGDHARCAEYPYFLWEPRELDDARES